MVEVVITPNFAHKDSICKTPRHLLLSYMEKRKRFSNTFYTCPHPKKKFVIECLGFLFTAEMDMNDCYEFVQAFSLSSEYEVFR